jgi:hypothetical protein
MRPPQTDPWSTQSYVVRDAFVRDRPPDLLTYWDTRFPPIDGAAHFVLICAYTGKEVVG